MIFVLAQISQKTNLKEASSAIPEVAEGGRSASTNTKHY